MATQTLGIILTGTDKLSSIFKKNGDAAKAMGADVQGSLDRASGSFGKIAAAGAAWGAAAGAVVDVTRAATAAYAESEAAQLRLEGAIANAGQSFDAYKTQIEAASDAAVQLGFDDEDLSDALTALTQATGDTGAALNDLAMVQDLARARNMSLANAAKVVADAEAGRMRGLVGLGLGIDASMSKEQAFALILEKTGGAAEAYGNSTAGAIDRVQVQLGNLLEAAGGFAAPIAPLVQMLPAVTGGYTALSTVIGAVTATMAGQTAVTAAATTATTGLAVAEGAASAATAGASVALVAEAGAATTAAAGMTAATVAAGALQLALGPVGLALMAVTAVVAITKLTDQQKHYAAETVNSVKANDQLGESLIQLGASSDLTRQNITQLDSIIGSTTVFDQRTQAQVEAANGLVDLTNTLLEYGQTNGTVNTNLKVVNGEIVTTGKEIKNTGLAIDDATLSLIEAGGGLDLLKLMAADGTVTVRELNDVLRYVAIAGGDANAALGTTTEILGKANQEGVNTTDVLAQVSAAWDEYNASTDPNRLEILNTKLEGINTTLDTMPASVQQANKAIDDWALAWDNALNPMDDVTAAMGSFAGAVAKNDPALVALTGDLDALSGSLETSAQVAAWWAQVLSGDLSIEDFQAKVHALRVEVDATAKSNADQATRIAAAWNDLGNAPVVHSPATAALEEQSAALDAQQAQMLRSGTAAAKVGREQAALKTGLDRTSAAFDGQAAAQQRAGAEAAAFSQEQATQQAALDKTNGAIDQQQALFASNGAAASAYSRTVQAELIAAWRDATRAAADLGLQADTLVAQLLALGEATQAQNLAYNLNVATAAADDLRRVIIQIPDGIASAAQSTLDWANDLVNVRGEWGRIDELQREMAARGTPELFTDTDWENAQRAQESLQQSTADIQLYTDVIQAKLIPYLADAQNAQALYLEGLVKLPPEQQLAALGYMDQAESAKALAVAQQMAAATTTEQKAQTEAMVAAMIAADPTLKAMLLDMGLIHENGKGEISFDFANADATVTTLDDVVEAVETLAFVLAEAFDITIPTDGVATATTAVNDLVTSMGAAQDAATTLQGATDLIPPSVAIGIPIATPTGDDPAAVLEGIAEQQAAINTTPTTVALQYPQVTAGYSKARDLADKLDDIDAAVAAPTVDTRDILNGYSAAGFLGDKLDDLDRQNVAPAVDDGDIWRAWNAGADLQAKLQALDGYVVDITVRYHTEGTPPQTPPGQGPGGGNYLGGVITPRPAAYALGGRVSLVGETGPELVRLPYGSMVTPATATRQLLGSGGGGAVNLYGPVTVVANDPQAFAAKLRARRLTEARA